MQVNPSESSGVYQVSGSTNLPDDTQITVAAVRYLQVAGVSARKQTYAILDYQSAEVKDGNWQTNLNLWETAADGRYQENWQLDQAHLDIAFEPNQDVFFLATLAPIEELSQIEELLATRGLRLQRGMIRSTSAGQRYVQVSQTRTIALPTGQTTPPVPRPEDINGGWGDRFIIPQEPQNLTPFKPENARLTNAPAAPEDFLR